MRFLACALLLIATTHAVEVCNPGEQRQDGKNVCTCLGDGTGWTCVPSARHSNNPLLKKSTDVADDDDKCEPGKHFKLYCNTCLCGLDGRVAGAACTRMACNVNVWNKDGTKKVPSYGAAKAAHKIIADEDRCEPGKPFKHYCNTCTCGPTGRTTFSACTLMACDLDVWNKDGTRKNPVVVHPEENQDTCEPGKTFKRYCNTCTCGPTGRRTFSACTLKACDLNVWNMDGTQKNPVVVHPEENQDTCEPGKTFKRYCNTCTCGPTGRVAFSVCTMMACDLNVWNKDGTQKHSVGVQLEENLDTCEPGRNFMYYCNRCRCGPDGRVAHSACTRMACSPAIWNKDGTLKIDFVHDGSSQLRTIDNSQERCEPLQPFRKYCNICTCGPDGLADNAVCTKMYCDMKFWNKDGTHKVGAQNNPMVKTARSQEFLCQPDYTFKDDCNMCTCGRDGKGAACTFKFCSHSSDERVAAPKVCEPGKNFKIQCNECTCSKDGTKVACTRMACSLSNDEAEKNALRKTVHSAQFLCQPGYSFKDDCNTCTCAKDGKRAACTQMYCVHDNDERVAAPKVCQPGKSFKIDCNTCVCSRDGTAIGCTKMGCPKPNDEAEKKALVKVDHPTEFLCQPGYSYKNDCNTCTCGSDGRSGVCTLKGCIHNNDEQVLAPKVCEPGKNFKIDCNHCQCSKDGTTVACTRMACSPVAVKKQDHPTEFLCQPGYSYKNDCNTCTCGSDGRSGACTLKGCIHNNDEQVLAPRICEAGKKFKIDCNQCRCSRDGTSISCTRMACPPREEKKQTFCEPNKSFRSGCNNCVCNNDGTDAICTMRACVPGEM